MELWGNLKDFSLPDIIQLVGFGRKTGVLTVENKVKSLSSMLYFLEGNVVHAESEGIEGQEAVYRLFCVQEGEFRFKGDSNSPKRTIFMDPTNLVMEAARLLDESNRTDNCPEPEAQEAQPEPEAQTYEEHQESVGEETAYETFDHEIEVDNIVESIENSFAKEEAAPKVEPAPQPPPAPEPPAVKKVPPAQVRKEIMAYLESSFGKESKRLTQAVEKCGDSLEDFQQLSTRVERFVVAFVDPASAKKVGEELRRIISQL